MKKYLLLSTFFFTALVFGCAVTEEDETRLTISVNSISVPCTGGQYTIEVTSNTQWSVSTVGAVVSADRTSGSGNGKVTVTVGPNDSDSQTELVQISSSGKFPVNAICEFVRMPYPSLSVERESIAAPHSGSSQVVVLKTNTKWKAETTGDFISVSPSEGQGNTDVTITVEGNTVTQKREGSVLFSTVDAVVVTDLLVVNQTALSYVTPSVATIDVPREGGTYNVGVDSNVTWQVESVEAAGGFAKAAVYGSGLTITVEPNSGSARRALLTLTTVEEYPATATVEVRQAPDPKISLGYYELQVPMTGGEFKVELSANTSWSAVFTESCVRSVTPSSGTGSAEITIAVKSSSGADVTSLVTFTTDGANAVSAALTVTQSATPMIAVNPITINSATADAVEYSVSVVSNTSWSVASSTSGISSVAPSSGSESMTVRVAVAENTGAASVEKVVFKTSDGTKSATLTVNRPAVLSVSPASATFPFGGGTQQITITTTKPWTVSSSSQAVTFSAASGTGNAVVTATAAANESIAAVSGTITITAGSASASVSFTQPRPHFVYGGETYYIVKLKDGRWWMADNMRYVPSGYTPSSNPATESGIWYPYTDYVEAVYQTDAEGKRITDADGNYIILTPASWTVLTDAASVRTYGYLYDASTALGRTVTADNYTSLEGKQGICPSGWHIPSRAEFDALIQAYERASADDFFYIEDVVADGFLAYATGLRQRNNYTDTGRYSNQISGFFTSSTGASVGTTGVPFMHSIFMMINNSASSIKKGLLSRQSTINAGTIRCIKNN